MSDMATKRPQAGWTTVAFGDVVRQVKDKVDPEASGLERYVAGEHMDTDDLRIRRWGEIGDGYLGPAFHMRFKPGQVLYGSRRTYLRKVAVADFEGITANTTYVLESANPDVLLPELLPFIMQTEAFNQHSVRESKGSVNPYVNFSDLAWFEFTLPPIEEQRRAILVLSRCRVMSSCLESAAVSLRAIEEATLEQIAASSECDHLELGSLLIDSPRNGCSAHPASSPTGHFVFALSAITPWGYRPGELKPVEPTPEMLAARATKGDLFVSRSNTRDRVGLPMLFSEDRDDVSYPDTMMRLRFDEERTAPGFMECALRSKRCRKQIESFAAGTSASMKKISGANIRRVRVPHPTLPAQREFLALRDRLRRQAEAVAERVEGIHLVASAVMARPASGEERG